MRYRRITMPDFRPCPACLPRSQAPFCHCTRRTVANRAEGTFGSLRYSFGGDHPSQTTRQAVSLHKQVRSQTDEGWYFKVGSPGTGVPGSQPPTYPTHRPPNPSAKL